MANAGFTSQLIPHSALEDIESLDKVDSFLRSEVSNLSIYEDQILRELRDVKGFIHNAEIILNHVLDVQKMYRSYEAIHKKIVSHSMSRSVDITLMKQYIGIARKIESQLLPLFARLTEDIKTLIVNDTHEIYVASQANRETMNKIDESTRNASAELRVIGHGVGGLKSDVDFFERSLERVEVERVQQSSPQNVAGFTQRE